MNVESTSYSWLSALRFIMEVYLGSVYSHLNRYARSAVARLDLVFAAPSTGSEESHDERQQRAYFYPFVSRALKREKRTDRRRTSRSA
jgi:hypothetical protein